MYSEHEIKRMEAALALLRDSRQSVEGRLVRNALRGGNVNVRQLENELSDRLKLIGGRGDFWFLTAEGKTAAAMGMKAYLQEQERKAQEPKKMMLLEKKFLGLSRSEWIAVVGIAIGLLGLLVGFLR